MASKLLTVLLLISLTRVESAGLLEKSYDYVVNLGKNLAPSLLEMLDCFSETDVWGCARLKAGKILDVWSEDVNNQRRSWQDEADAEIVQSGRSLNEMPSKLGKEVESSLNSLAVLVEHGVARAMSRKHDDSGGIDTITISTGSGGKKKKEKKKKKKPAQLQLVQLPMMMEKMEEKEQRGKKKKKKKAILKLLLLGAVLKAKIGTLLQILSFKLQVKFFLIALAGLAINAARFWIDLKKQHQQPQKVIYYEHAQHQHHYDEHEEPGWGPWSRSMDSEETEEDPALALQRSPYRAQEKTAYIYRPNVVARV